MAFKMKGSPFKQATLEGKNKISEGNTKKAKNKPKEKTITDFTSDTQEASGPQTHDSNQYRTWKDLHWIEKGAAINVGLVPFRIARDLMKKKK
jgi:hypothetical protein